MRACMVWCALGEWFVQLGHSLCWKKDVGVLFGERAHSARLENKTLTGQRREEPLQTSDSRTSVKRDLFTFSDDLEQDFCKASFPPFLARQTSRQSTLLFCKKMPSV